MSSRGDVRVMNYFRFIRGVLLDRDPNRDKEIIRHLRLQVDLLEEWMERSE